MANEYFDRYQLFKENGKIGINIPFIKISEKNTDKREVYHQGITRFDKLSQKYYGNPFHGWLIMMSNPQFGGLEFDIPDSSIIVIPFPFRQSLEEYFQKMNDYLKL